MGFFRSLRFDIKYMFEEILILIKHPTRKTSYHDLKSYWNSIWRTIIFHPWYCLKRGVRNIWIWFPLIWENDCWDYFQLCNLMDKQLLEMENFWKTKAEEERKGYINGEHEKGFRCQDRRKYKRIKWTRKYMEMWRGEYYNMKAYYENKNLFPRQNELFCHDESLTTYDKYGIPILYTCKPMDEDCANDFRMRIEIARKMEAKTLKLWLKNLGYIQYWWD